MAQRPRRHGDYQVGIVCALPEEKSAVVAMLDECHVDELTMKNGDSNNYSFGRIGVHNVVIGCLPAGIPGTNAAAIVANNMLRSFQLKFGLLVGIGGGVWSKRVDVRLGDVVISKPTKTHGGVVQWDLGKIGSGGQSERTGCLDKPPLMLLHALQSLREKDIMDGIDIKRHISLMVQNKPRMAKGYCYQGVEHDQIFESESDHEGDENSFDGCNPVRMIQRHRRDNCEPRIHYGNIASGNRIMKHGITRDRIANEEEIICFEMEAAGLMDNFPCLVIRGICDYADSHKNKRWQKYASATAAACAKELLMEIPAQSVRPVNEEEKRNNLNTFTFNNSGTVHNQAGYQEIQTMNFS